MTRLSRKARLDFRQVSGFRQKQGQNPVSILIFTGLSVLVTDFSYTNLLKWRKNQVEKTVAQLYVDLQSRPDGKDSVFYIKGYVYSFIDGVRPERLLGLEGFNVRRRIETSEKDGFFVATRELLFYTDPKSGQVIEEWENPFTGKRNEVFHIANDPVNFRMRQRDGKYISTMLDGSRELGEPAPPVEWDDFFVWGSDIFPFYPIPEREKNYTAAEIFDFYVPKAALYTEEVPSIMNSWVRVGPWLPWMEMDRQEGHVVYHAHSKRYEDWELLPPHIKQLTRERYPQYQTAPDTVDPKRPNATSWSVYREEIARRQK